MASLNTNQFIAETITDTHVVFLRGPFSNFHHCCIQYGNVTFKNSEQLFMYLKAKHFNDNQTAAQITGTPNPAEAKRLGRQVKGFIASQWEQAAYDAMLLACTLKFKQNHSLRTMLLNTGDKELVEANQKDRRWSCGYYPTDPRCLDESKWYGTNWLGKILMEVRNQLKEE